MLGLERYSLTLAPRQCSTCFPIITFMSCALGRVIWGSRTPAYLISALWLASPRPSHSTREFLLLFHHPRSSAESCLPLRRHCDGVQRSTPPSAMELSMRLPVLPPQCYSPSPDHGYEGRREVPPSSRQPLQESTGNIQHPHMAWYAQQLNALSSIPPAIPAPPVLRTQSFGPDYATPATGYTRSQQQERLDHQLHRRRRVQQGTNPLMPLLAQAFQNYRKKQANKPEQTWPDVLETHFLDALLLIPQIGRKKYTVRQTKSGRNMLIGDYLWIAYCQGLPAGTKPDATMFRGRKMVSSHIQVLKNFFKRYRWFHFFFSARKDEDDADGIETVSLKRHPVLIAVSEGRLPDERPNYEYFAHILALNDQVQFRPKRCWIFVSHEDVVVGADGVGHLPATGGRFSESEYPHLPRNLERDAWAKEEQQFFKGALLHEFTKELHQVESGSVREVSRKWESAFPELHQRLKAITSTTTDARCDMLHMHATLELKEKRRFPSGSNLSSWVEINIEQPRLLNHRWKVETRLVRPAELGYPQDDAAPEVIYEPSKKEFSIPYQHRPGCDGPRNDGRGGFCDCLARRTSREGVTVPFPVPFPADVWAQTLTNCAEYPAHPYSGSKRQDRERSGATKTKTEDGDEQDSRSRRRSKQLTQMDLVPKIAMMQEILSCPPTAPHEDGSSSSSGSQRWTCRAVILWTFETTHRLNKEGKLVTTQARTDWRFLTILDPASDYHQRNAMISSRRSSAADDYPESAASLVGASRPVSREAVMSPSPTYQQHLSANMSETFSSAWDGTGGLESLSGPAAQAAAYGGAHFMPHAIPSHSTASSQSYGLLDSFSSHGGLVTPPPSASLASSFAQTFDMAVSSADMLPSYMATTAGLDASSHALGGGLSAVADPFLAHVGIPYAETAHDGLHGWTSSSHAGSVDSGSPWSTTFAGGASGIHHAHSTTTAGSWAGSQPQSASSRRGSDQLPHNQQGAQQQHQHQNQHRQARQQLPPWASCTTTPTDEHDSSSAWASNKTAQLASLITTRDHHHHQTHGRNHNHQSHNTSTTQSHAAAHPSHATVPGVEEEGGQNWAHLHAAPSSDDLSHDWEHEEEEEQAIPTTATPPSPGQQHQQNTRHSYHGGGGGRPLKRGREDEDEDGDDGFGDAGLDDGYGVVGDAVRQGPAKRARADHGSHSHGAFDGGAHEEDGVCSE